LRAWRTFVGSRRETSDNLRATSASRARGLDDAFAGEIDEGRRRALSDGSTAAAPDLTSLVACHDCDLIHRKHDLAEGERAHCSRCGALLTYRPVNGLDRSLAFTYASVVLFVLANVYPFMFFKIQGQVEVNRMITGVIDLVGRGMASLAFVILMTSIVVPGVKIALTLYILVPIKMGGVGRHAATAYRWLRAAGPWGMLEVYLMGLLVAVVNLLAIASIELGVASFCFVALMFTTTAASSHLDDELIRRRLEVAR
jgi:paraquat-inducible protein A